MENGSAPVAHATDSARTGRRAWRMNCARKVSNADGYRNSQVSGTAICSRSLPNSAFEPGFSSTQRRKERRVPQRGVAASPQPQLLDEQWRGKPSKGSALQARWEYAGRQRTQLALHPARSYSTVTFASSMMTLYL
jgi:hypothetical protein